jgi:hypothetical protein
LLLPFCSSVLFVSLFLVATRTKLCNRHLFKCQLNISLRCCCDLGLVIEQLVMGP